MGARGNRRRIGNMPSSLIRVVLVRGTVVLDRSGPTGGSGEYTAVRLDDGQELVVAVEF